MSIRPKPGECRTWAEEVGFVAISTCEIELPPYHYGLLLDAVAEMGCIDVGQYL